jgi:beta-carotene hydroxylase
MTTIVLAPAQEAPAQEVGGQTPAPGAPPRKPSLRDLGLDLLEVTRWERWSALVLPFLCATGFLAFGTMDWWPAALACAVALSFFTYASVSHDLVHRTLRLPPRVNELLLCLIELICFRSGHAFRVTHLHHHARFPADDDLEGRAARMAWWRALLDGVVAQPRQWLWALGHAPDRERRWVVAEGILVIVLAATCLLAWPLSPVPAAYALVIIAGSWIYPFMTSFMPHNAAGADTLSQTRLFRGRVISLLAVEHLYHLEHHLYPQVPHHRWPELARRLDPYFAEMGLHPITLWK